MSECYNFSAERPSDIAFFALLKVRFKTRGLMLVISSRGLSFGIARPSSLDTVLTFLKPIPPFYTVAFAVVVLDVMLHDYIALPTQ